MAEIESGIIEHLLEVENTAYKIVAEAQSEASKMISDAKTKAGNMFSNQFGEIVKAEEAKFEAEKNAVSEKYEKTLADFKAGILTSKKADGEFAKYLSEKLYG